MDCTVSTGAAAMMAVRVLLVWRVSSGWGPEGGFAPRQCTEALLRALQ